MPTLMEQEETLKHVVNQLYEVGGLKFGNFIMKSGCASPVYIDLRVLISHPKLMESVALLMWEVMGSKLTFNSICGVPYNALPIATVIAIKHDIPMLIRRKEVKQYGTKKLIEGDMKQGDYCVIIEDVVTTGSSILETVKDLQREGLKIKDAIVLIDRQQGGNQILGNEGITLHSLCSLVQMLQILRDSNKIDQEMFDKVHNYLKENQAIPKPVAGLRLSMAYETRAGLTKCSVAQKLLTLMSEKRSNLCVAADVSNSSDLINLARLVGPHICLLKTHADIVTNFTACVADELIELAQQFNFMILEDRKFADIGSTVVAQYTGGMYDISRWADLVTAHALPGEGVLKGIQQGANNIQDANRGCFLLAEMSCKGNLITPEYVQATLAMASNYADFVIGLVCQSPLADNSPGLVQLTPGVRRGVSSDGLGQQWVSPEDAILLRGADIAVVGRGITQAKDMSSEAKIYQEQLWAAYEKRICK